eukprot:356968-Chlamydomonas_euryale.AAC.6
MGAVTKGTPVHTVLSHPIPSPALPAWRFSCQQAWAVKVYVLSCPADFAMQWAGDVTSYSCLDAVQRFLRTCTACAVQS